jgi:hypothetical protein
MIYAYWFGREIILGKLDEIQFGPHKREEIYVTDKNKKKIKFAK